MKKHKTKIIWTVVIVGLMGLMYWGGGASSAATWEDTEISCLAGGHQGLAFHIHSDLSVTIDGQQQIIPANTGINSTCMAEVHTHDASGYIHVESTDRSAVLTLADFFAVWGEPIDRDSYEATVLVNNEESDFNYEFRDGDDVKVAFTSIDTESTDETGEAATSSEDSSSTTTDVEVEVDAGTTTSVDEV